MIGDRIAIDAWRPQRFGTRNARRISNPVVEPLWSGVRVLAHVDGGRVVLRDADGGAVDQPSIADALSAAVLAESAVVDGYVTDEAAQSGVGVLVGPVATAPTAGQMARQMLIGSGVSRRQELIDAFDDAPAASRPSDEAVLVAVDLLWLDGESLLDVPLLERKRLLDGVVAARDLVRIGVHVRPPVDQWLPTWRTLGFRSLAYKDANGRYRPGEASDGWATAVIPRG